MYEFNLWQHVLGRRVLGKAVIRMEWVEKPVEDKFFCYFNIYIENKKITSNQITSFFYTR